MYPLRTNTVTHLEPDVVGKLVFLNQAADEAKLCLTRRGESRFNLLEAALEEKLEEDVFLLYSHRVHQSLVSISQVGGSPPGGLGNPRVGPGAVR